MATTFSSLKVTGTATLVSAVITAATITTLGVTTGTFTTANVRTLSGSLVQVQNGAGIVEATTLSGASLKLVTTSTTAGDLACFKANGVLGKIPRANTGGITGTTCQ